MRQAGGVQRGQRGPCAIDIIHPPAAIPGAIGLLLGQQILHRLTRGLLSGHAQLGQHGEAAPGYIGRRRVEQRAVIGEGDVVEVVMGVVSIKGAPAAALALHANGPVRRALDGLVGARRRGAGGTAMAVHGQHHHGGVIHIGVMRVLVLEGPAARLEMRPLPGPVAAHLGDLAGQKPFDAAADRLLGLRPAGLEQRMRHEGSVPDWREAGLDIGFTIRPLTDEFFDGGPGGCHARVALGHTHDVIHENGIGHGGVDRAQPILAIEPLGDESLAGRLGADTMGAREDFLGALQGLVHGLEQAGPGFLLMRAPRPFPHLIGWGGEKFGDVDTDGRHGLWPAGHHHRQRHQHGARPITDFADMEGKPSGQQNEFWRHDRHGMPGHLAEQGQGAAGEDIAPGRAARGQNCLPRSDHMRRIGGITDQAQGEIRLY